mgnify:CR=1 FL=1
MTKENLLQHLQECCDRMFGCSLEMATEKQVYRAVCVAVRELLEDERRAFVEQTRAQENKQVYYMSMEFLVGTSLRNNLFNMGLLEPAGEILNELGFSLERLCALEPDAGLGNGGLGRLASCYMDAATGLGYPVTGFSIRYEFGIFRQKIVDGWQMEFPDNWLEMGDVWLHPRKDDAVEVRFGGQVHEWMDGDKFKTAQTGYQSVIAVPHDLYISGYNSTAVNKLTLWSASMPQSFDMNAFSRGDYVRALEQNTMAEAISKVLYPADNHINGKRLRLRQQYLLVSSSLQSILNEHLKNYHTLDNLADKVAVHINDTHPALCVPELMRLLVDEYDYGWDRAWEITCATLSYTNHTVMAEALERWPVSLFQEQLPRIYSICQEINRRLMEKLQRVYPNDPGKWNYMAVIANDEVRMANLCLTCCHKINGVSQLHTDILEKTIFRDYYNLDHSRFLNITNGIAYRRWLCQSNPALSGYLQTLIGDGFLKDANALEALLPYRDDPDVLENLQAIKRKNKVRLAAYIAEHNGVNVDPDAIFDVQVKRLHEYKRQLLNALHILVLYNRICDDPNYTMAPRTFIFGAKAAPGYRRAKEIIHFINVLAAKVASHERASKMIKIAFLQNYNVSTAEMLMPASEVSEQLSTASKEASGTGNMKFMMNGAVTIGTLDGANVEIADLVGNDNCYIFGMRSNEVEALYAAGTYRSLDIYETNAELRRALNMMFDGSLTPENPKMFEGLYRALVFSDNGGMADPYLVLKDFGSYQQAQSRLGADYLDQKAWTRKEIINVAKSGIFSSDRTIREYNDLIWHLTPLTKKHE